MKVFLLVACGILALLAIQPTQAAAPSYESLGCFAINKPGQGPHPLPRFIDNFSHPIKMLTPKLIIDACAERVQEKGFKYFGISHNGACWSGPTAETTYNTYGPSDKCYYGLGGSGPVSVYHTL